MSSFSPPSKPAPFSSSSPSPPSPPPSVTSAQEDAFRSSQSRVLLVCGVPPDCGNQQDLLGWLSSRAAAGGRSSGGSLGVIGVFRHATEQAGTTSEADWWVVFREHELVRPLILSSIGCRLVWNKLTELEVCLGCCAHRRGTRCERSRRPARRCQTRPTWELSKSRLLWRKI